MTAINANSSSAADQGKDAQDHAAPFVEKLARAGYATKGFTYLLLGVLAAKAAFMGGGEIGGSKNALQTLVGDGIVGTILLWAVGIGLAGYGLWQFFRATLDPEDEGSDAKGITKRIFFGFSGILHGALAFYVFSSLLGLFGSSGGSSSGSSGSSGGTRTMIVGTILEWGVLGQILIAAVGAGILVLGIIQAKKAFTADLSDQLDLSSLDQSKASAVRKVARTGLGARAAVFAIIAWLFVQAAYYGNSEEAGGLEQAMKFFSGVSWLVLGVVAIGLACYGAYMIVKSRYRRIDAS